MNEWIAAEFMVSISDQELLLEKLELLGKDFIRSGNDKTWIDIESPNIPYICISGKINSYTASIIKLQDPFLAEHMRVSYIPNELKDKYRR